MVYQSREDLLQENRELTDALEDIYTEVSSDDPDVDRIANLAADAVGIESEDEE